VSIDDVMAEAGLTRGSFYCYFTAKSDFYAQSVARIVHEDKRQRRRLGKNKGRQDRSRLFVRHRGD
jgi:AcrR family transcriptional regulator